MSAIDVLSIGEPLVEFNQTRAGEPGYLQGFGGDSSNMIIAAARSGARTAVRRASRRRRGLGGRSSRLWRTEGVDTRGVGIDREARTAVYFVRHGPQGHVFSYLRAGSAASRMRPRVCRWSSSARHVSVHASGISMAISASAADAVLAAFEGARAAGAKVSLDWNLSARRGKSQRSSNTHVSAIAEHLKYGMSFFA